MARFGKIARLPREVRAQLSSPLKDGLDAQSLLHVTESDLIKPLFSTRCITTWPNTRGIMDRADRTPAIGDSTGSTTRPLRGPALMPLSPPARPRRRLADGTLRVRQLHPFGGNSCVSRMIRAPLHLRASYFDIARVFAQSHQT